MPFWRRLSRRVPRRLYSLSRWARQRVLRRMHILNRQSRQIPRLRFVHNELNLPQADVLLDGAADPNLRVFGGYTPFIVAVERDENNTELIEELIAAGADVNSATHLDYTPLHLAVIKRKQRVVHALIQSGALVNAKNFFGETALHYAVTSSTSNTGRGIFYYVPDSRIIQKLLNHEDTDCNVVDSNGNSPLMAAINQGQSIPAVLLLNNGANPNTSNNMSQTPLHMAIHKKSIVIVSHLLLHGADIDTVDNLGQTPVDMLFKDIKRDLLNKWKVFVFKTLAFKYYITEDLKRKLQCFPRLQQFLMKCCDEVNRMRSDFISDNINMHDFVMKCFNEADFNNPLLQIYKPVVERLIDDVYPEYFWEVLRVLPKLRLLSVLEEIADRNKNAKDSEIKDLAYMVSRMDYAALISRYLSDLDVFKVVVAISNTKIPTSMRNLDERKICTFFRLL